MLKLNEKEYLKASGENATDIKITLFYDLGGCNYFNGGKNERGYYVSVLPVERKDQNGWRSESFTMFTGTKYLLEKVERRSKAAELRASEKLEQVKNQLVDYVCKKYGVQLV